MRPETSSPALHEEVEDLRSQLAEAEETLRAIRSGEAEALVITCNQGDEVHFLGGRERVYRQFSEAMGGGTATLSADMHILSCDARLATTLCLSVDQIVGTDLGDHFSPEDREGVGVFLAQSEAVSAVRRIRLVTSEGHVVPAYLTATILRSPGAQPLTCLTFADLTTVISAETALDESESRLKSARARALLESERQTRLLRHAEAVACAGSWRIDLGTGRASWSEGAYHIFGLEPDALSGQLAEGIGKMAIHPDDRDMVERLGASLLEDGIPRPAEYRIVLPDGSIRWVHSEGTIEADEDGNAVGVVGYIQDITERRTARDEIEQMLEERGRHVRLLKESLSSMVDVVGRVVEIRDPYTAGHERHVSELAERISQEMGMPAEDIEEIRVAALIHDVGKISVPAEILTKPGRLLPVEFELVKNHSEAGFSIITLAHMGGSIAEMVRQHHERCDGSGYPRGLAGKQLLTGAKVLMVADVVEAMSAHRPYRAALGIEAALAEIEDGAGTRYDAEVSKACMTVFRERGFAFSDT